MSGFFSTLELRARGQVSRAMAGPFRQLCEAPGGACGAQAARACVSQQDAGKRRAARAMQERAGCQRTFHDDRASSEEEEEERTGRLGKRFVISLRSYFFAPPPLPPATRSPRKEGGAALWQVARRTHARKGKSGLRGCRNLDFDAAQC